MVVPEELPAAAKSLTDKMTSKSKENNEDPGDILKALSPPEKIFIHLQLCVFDHDLCLYSPI